LWDQADGLLVVDQSSCGWLPTNAESLLGAGKLMEQAGDLAGADTKYLKTAEMGKGESVERSLPCT